MDFTRQFCLKRCRLLFSVVSVGILCITASCADEADSPRARAKNDRRPNIILISSDTLRADHLGCYGYERETSPNIDRFVQEAVLFENAVTQAPHTAPAHMSIFTAVTPAVHNVKNHRQDGGYKRLKDALKTLPEILKENGYMTAAFTGGGSVSGDLGFDRGFEFYGMRQAMWEKVYRDPTSLDPIRDWIRRSKEETQPLFLFLHNHLCHDPYTRAPHKYRTRFLDEKVEGLPLGPKDITNDQGYAASRESFWDSFDMSDPSHVKHVVALYDGGILYMDYVIHQLMTLLKEETIYEDSIIIFLSDHGEEFYEHGTYLHGYLFVETMHVPLIIKFPKSLYAGKRSARLVRTMDVMPTLLDYIGIENDHFTQGMSLMPLLDGSGEYDPTILSYDGGLESIRFHEDGFFYSNQAAPGSREWLFDIANDPQEKHNLISAKPKVAAQMRTQSKKLMRSDKVVRKKYGRDETKVLKADEETMKQLRALGYVQ